MKDDFYGDKKGTKQKARAYRPLFVTVRNHNHM